MVSKTEECTRCKNKNFLIECGCKCGQLRTYREAQGRVRLYIHGHNTRGQTSFLGKKHTEDTKQKMSQAAKGNINGKGHKVSYWHKQKITEALTGEKNSQWKGDNVGLRALHRWVSKRLQKPDLCEICKVRPPHDLANISHTYNPLTYTRDLQNWHWLCRRCHMISDGILIKAIQTRKKKSV